MAQKATVLSILKIDRFKQNFGNGTTDYASFLCETADKKRVSIAVTHNALTDNFGIGKALFSRLVGSQIEILESTDIRTGLFSTAQEQLDKVLSDHDNGALHYSDWQEVKNELILKFIEK